MRNLILGFLLTAALVLAQTGGDIRYNQIYSGDRSGNGAKVQMQTGTAATGDLAKFSSGNVTGVGASGKGTIFVYDGTTVTVLAVGTNGYKLKANSATATGLEWAADTGSESTTVTNSGTGASVLKTGTNVEARKLLAGTGITVTENTDTVSITSSVTGESTSVSNSGASGAAVLKTGTNVTARKLVAGTNVTVTEGVDAITIASSAGDTTSVANSGAGAQVLKSGTNVTARTLVAGSNVTVTQNTDTITVAATVPDAIPSGAVMPFNLTSCPTGWTEFTYSRGRYIVGRPSGGSNAGTVGTALTDLENRATGIHTHGITTGLYGTSAGGYVLQGYSSGAGYAMGEISTGLTINNSTGVAGTNAPYIQLLICSKN